MKFALIDAAKSVAIKGLKGTCPNCGSEVIAKCGEFKQPHWAHKAIRSCDPWWESETEWHRNWKNNFPIEWQEVIKHDELTGEKHIATFVQMKGWSLSFSTHILIPSSVSNGKLFIGQ